MKNQSQEIKAPTPRHRQSIALGVFFGILAAINFTLMSFFGKLIGDKASIETILFARFSTSLVLIFPWVMSNFQDVREVSHPTKILLRSVLTLLSLVCFFYSLQFISLANTLLLNNTAPLFVPIVAGLTFGVKTSYRVWLGIMIGFIGIGLVLNPSQNFFEFASLIGLCSGLFAAIAIVTIRSLTKTASILQILFYNFLICSILTALFLPLHWKPLDSHTLLLLSGLGLFGTIYQLLSTLAFAKAPVRITSTLMFLCIVFGVIIDFIAWHQIPKSSTLLGMALVIAGGVVTLYFGRKEIYEPLNKK